MPMSCKPPGRPLDLDFYFYFGPGISGKETTKKENVWRTCRGVIASDDCDRKQNDINDKQRCFRRDTRLGGANSSD